MELFQKAKAVRLRSHHEKYLYAEEDEESVSQDRSGACKNARWTVEFIDHCNHVLRLKSCYGRYLTASNEPFLLGMTGKKVSQTLPRRLNSSVEWEPIREGSSVKFKTRYGNFLRANGGLPPWRNSVTHDIPHRTSTQDWVVWDVDVVQIRLPPPSPPVASSPPDVSLHSNASRKSAHREDQVQEHESLSSNGSFDRTESLPSAKESPPRADGRLIYYKMGNENGDVDDTIEWPSFVFKGTHLEELMQKVEEETGIHDVILCNRNPVNGKLYPLRLQLPPNNAAMHLVLIKSSCRMASWTGVDESYSLASWTLWIIVISPVKRCYMRVRISVWLLAYLLFLLGQTKIQICFSGSLSFRSTFVALHGRNL